MMKRHVMRLIGLLCMAWGGSILAENTHVNVSLDPHDLINQTVHINVIDANEQLALGLQYANGNGVPKNLAKAVHWFIQAAKQHNAYAQFNLRLMYANGLGVDRNDVVAFNWYRQAAQLGNANAQNNLGAMYVNGQGVKHNLKQAVVWYEKAAKQGDVSAQLNLANSYLNGEGVKVNRQKAIKWYKKAAAQGHALAKFQLGLKVEMHGKIVNFYDQTSHWQTRQHQASQFKGIEQEQVNTEEMRHVKWFSEGEIKRPASHHWHAEALKQS